MSKVVRVINPATNACTWVKTDSHVKALVAVRMANGWDYETYPNLIAETIPDEEVEFYMPEWKE